MLTDNEESLDRLFFALSDRSRRKMLMELAQGEKGVLELGIPFGMSKQLVSKHLNVLEKAGLVEKRKDGRVRRCRMNPQKLELIQEVIGQYKKFWEGRFDALEEYINQSKNLEGKKQ